MLVYVYAALIAAFFVVLAWSLYNVPILAAGVRSHRSPAKRKRVVSLDVELPSFSIVVPVKSEGKVIGRTLESLSKLDYPRNKLQIIVVEDGSADDTVEICRSFAVAHKDVKLEILSKPVSDGKSSALNYALKHASGEFVGVFDADSVLASDALLNVGKYFENENVAAVQGRVFSLNSDENMLTKFISYEDLVWCEAYLRGKDALNLFVHLRGSCQFLRRSVLDELNGFDENTLSEDMELSARLTEKNQRIRYASDVCCWQESVANLKQLFKQRTRWFRGDMEVAFRYGHLMAHPSAKSLDAEATLFAPLVLIVSILTYFAGFFSLFVPVQLGLMWQTALQFGAVAMMLLLSMCGLALVYASKPRRVTNVLWLVFIYFYWFAQTFIAIYAVLLIVFRRPSKWEKTEKTGALKSSGFVARE